MSGFGAIVLAGGAGRRLGGVDKPALPVGGRSMLDRVLDAVSGAHPRVVVGRVATVPDDVIVTVEDPPGGGPVAAIAAGLAACDGVADRVAIVAADLPFLTRLALVFLEADVEFGKVDGAVYVDEDGRRQLLCGMWRVRELRHAVDRLAERRELAGASMRELLAGLNVGESRWTDRGPPPWFDCDTDEDLRRAEKWAR
jgi:molybdopterin-guanine dinucleotide biosynthesis protein A